MANSKPVGVAYSDPDLSTGWGVNGTAVTPTGTELNKAAGVPASVSVVVTTPGASGTAECAFTFKDAAGNAIAYPFVADAYLASAADGLTINAAITSILAATTPVGIVTPLVTGLVSKFVTTAAGLVSTKITGVAATTYYLVFQTTGGRLVVSPALLTKA